MFNRRKASGDRREDAADGSRVTHAPAAPDEAASTPVVPEPRGPRSDDGGTADRRPPGFAVGVEDMLRWLEHGVLDPAADPPARGPRTADDDVAAQADSLQTTVSVQKQAQRMLALAMRMRADAAVQAERILHEAREAAGKLEADTRHKLEQTRAETREWATAQRSAVENTIREVVEAAQHDAESIRAEALRTARLEAEQAARSQAARALAEGEREAAMIRARARDVLGRLATTVGETANTLHGLSDLLVAHVDVLQHQRESIEHLAAEVEHQTRSFNERRPAGTGEEPDPAAPQDDPPGDDPPGDDPPGDDPPGDDPPGDDPPGDDPPGDDPPGDD
ncbi:MAG TPA: hypothetical protein VF416_01040, partial [Marmoricola sp.]